MASTVAFPSPSTTSATTTRAPSRGEQLGRDPAHAAGGAGDQRDLSVQTSHLRRCPRKLAVVSSSRIVQVPITIAGRGRPVEQPAVSSDVVHPRRVLSAALCVAIASARRRIRRTPRGRDDERLAGDGTGGAEARLEELRRRQRVRQAHGAARLRAPGQRQDDEGRAVAGACATDRKKRIGSLLMNPGGPGAPGTEFARDFASILPDKITKRFDIVGFDPRGAAKRAR